MRERHTPRPDKAWTYDPSTGRYGWTAVQVHASTTLLNSQHRLRPALLGDPRVDFLRELFAAIRDREIAVRKAGR